MALSITSASVRAFLQSIMPAPVCLRSLFTSAAVMLISICVCQLMFRLISPQRQVLLLLRWLLLRWGRFFSWRFCQCSSAGAAASAGASSCSSWQPPELPPGHIGLALLQPFCYSLRQHVHDEGDGTSRIVVR